MSEPIHILSLGAGEQSSTMAFMASEGEITPMPHCGIFADTQREPGSVYLWLSVLCGVTVKYRSDGRPYVEPGRYKSGKLSFPVHIVTAGDIGADAIRVRQRRDGKGSWVRSGIPHYSVNKDGSHGHGPRQCTHDFKLAPLAREQRVVMREVGTKRCIIWIGISTDEISRCKDSRVKYAKHRWPLIELGKSRRDCVNWLESRNLKAPRSACEFCPYHSDQEWRRLKDEEPFHFEQSCELEADYQEAKAKTVSVKGFTPFLHRSCIPLDQVDFSTEEERGQINMFNNECEGMCGV